MTPRMKAGASIALLAWVGAADAAAITPVVQTLVHLLGEADAGAGAVQHEATDQEVFDPGAATLRPLSTSLSVTADNGSAHVTVSGTLSATWDDELSGHVSFSRAGWETSDVDHGLASLDPTHASSFWLYTFESDCFCYLNVRGLASWEGSTADGLNFFDISYGIFGDFPPLDGVSLTFPRDAGGSSLVEARFPLRMGHTYYLQIYDSSFTNPGWTLGTRTTFGSGEFDWSIDVIRVPEPGTFALLGLGLMGLGLTRGRKAN